MFHMKHKYRFLNRYLQLYVIDILAPDTVNYHYTYLIGKTGEPAGSPVNSL